MAKHSKWAKVKNFKGAVDQKRASVFTKLGRAITVAAKQGGGDPAMNFHLRIAMDRAREASMPKDTIERAVLRGTGGLGDAEIEEVWYEGFGPGGAAVMVHALTDNRNRTIMNVRTLFSKHGGTLGGQNSVAWMFEKKGVIRVAGTGEERVLELIDFGAEDVQEEDGGFTVRVAPERLEEVKSAILKTKMPIEFAEAMLVPKEALRLASDEDRAKLADFVEVLEDDEDVDEVIINVEL